MPYEDVIQGSLKRETRIDSTDSARPAATINDEPPQFAQGLKPKKRKVVGTENIVQPDGQTVRVKTYDDGVKVTTKLFAKDYPNAKTPAPKGVPAELWDDEKGELKAEVVAAAEAEITENLEKKPARTPAKPKTGKG